MGRQTIGQHDIEALKTLAVGAAVYAVHDPDRDARQPTPFRTPRYNKRRASDALEERKAAARAARTMRLIRQAFGAVDKVVAADLDKINRQQSSRDLRTAVFEALNESVMPEGARISAIHREQWERAQEVLTSLRAERGADVTTTPFPTFEQWLKREGIRRGNPEREERLRVQYQIAKLEDRFSR